MNYWIIYLLSCAAFNNVVRIFRRKRSPTWALAMDAGLYAGTAFYLLAKI